jgi:gluconokinase
MILIVMGVSGCGKTTIGEMLAERLGCGFSDADAFHSEANKAKMAQGVALTDEDRWPWLRAIRAAIEVKDAAAEDHVFACSALKRAYRTILRGDDAPAELHFVYLEGSFAVLQHRLKTRKGHFFDPALLQSQLDTLEPPDEDEAMIVSIELTPEQIVADVLDRLDLR